LTGPGGSGKTRLALQVAHGLSRPEVGAAPFEDGVWLVELGAVADAALVPQAVTAAAGVHEDPHRPVTTTLTDALRGRRLLLVLDNCEHLSAACARLAATLLQACPALRILATSRQPLGVAGEVVRPVLPLPVPPEAAGPDELAGYAAARLFAQRVWAAVPAFAVAAQTAQAVVQVCRRLDGIPLALELAAARVPSLGLDQLAARLDQRFRLLTTGSPTAAPRQQTLRAMVDWSHGLLGEAERVLFRRLAVFAGGFTLEAAETVCADRAGREDPSRAPSPGGPGPPTDDGERRAADGRSAVVGQEDVLPLLLGLVDKSLVVAEPGAPGADPARYRLLETLRQYADERLLEAAEAQPVRRLLLDWCLSLAAEPAPGPQAIGSASWLDRLEAEHQNLRAALDWAVGGGAAPPESAASGAAEAGLRLATSLGDFWSIRGYWHEGRDRLARGIEAAPESRDRRLRARALRAAGVLARDQGDYPAAQGLLAEALAIARNLGDAEARATADILLHLARVSWAQGDLPAARAQLEESLTLAEAQGDRLTVAGALHLLAYITYHGDPRARRGFEESLALQRTLGDRLGVAESLHDLGYVLIPKGDCATARRLFEEALAIRRELGDQLGIAREVGALGNVALVLGDYATAWRLLQESLELSRERGARRAMAVALHKLGTVVHRRGDDPPLARSLQEQSLALAREVGDLRFVAHNLQLRGDLALAEGDAATAARHYEEGLALRRQLDDRNGIAASLLGLGCVALRTGDWQRAGVLVRESLTLAAESGYWPQAAHCLVVSARLTLALPVALPAEPVPVAARAARLLGAAEALRRRMGTPLPADERAAHERDLARARARLGEASFAEAWAEGQGLTPEQAVAYALGQPLPG
jgi:predicted ATPase